MIHAKQVRPDSRALTIILLVLACGASASAQTWTQAWSDEFNGAANSPINPANWQYDTGILNVNDEAEYYCAPTSNTNGCNPANPNAYIDGNGHLVIQAIEINSGVAPYSGSWTSARLNTGNNLQSFQYGRLESSMSLPIGPGLWPAFWALGTNITSVGWPTSGEMDFMENVPASSGLGPTVIKSTLHGGISSSNCYCGGNGLGQSYTFTGGTDVTSFHAYGAIWSPNMVQFYVDDPTSVFFVRTASDVPSAFTWDFNHPFFALLNLAVGGTGSWPGPPDNTTPNPAIMLVDYVRWYTPSAVTIPTMTGPAIAVTAGQTGASSVSLTSTSGSGRVYLSCTTTAPKSTCAVSSTDPLNQFTVDFSTSATATANVSVTTTANTAAAAMRWKTIPSGPWAIPSLALGTLLLALALVPARRQTGRNGMAAFGALLVLALLASCGGSSSPATVPPSISNGTAPGSYTITVNAYTVSNTTGTPDQTLSIPLTVN
jgi:beta-glucanase (GH16 family)